MRSSLLMVVFIVVYNIASSQSQGEVEQYYYTGGGVSTIVPRVYYQNAHSYFAEVRYNYEELETVSFNAGKMFEHKKIVSYSVAPFAGIVLGKLNGGSIGSNVKIEYKGLFFSSELQYTFSFQKRAEKFLLNWTEAGYQLTRLAYVGFALQLTHPYEVKNNWEPGVMIGVTYRAWTFPVYAFDPLGRERNFVAGINWEWKQGKKKTSMHKLKSGY
jgi:hypothetical protein